MTRTFMLALVSIMFAGCWEVGGANSQQSVVGNADGGNFLGQQIIIDEEGRHLVATGRGGKGIFAVDLATFASTPITLGFDAQRMVFAQGGAAYFIGVQDTEAATGGIGVVERVSLETGRRLGRWTTPGASGLVAYDPRTERIALWMYFGKEVHVLEPRAGKVTVHHVDRGAMDVRWTPRGDLAIVGVHDFRGDEPETPVTLVSPAGEERAFIVPNCASRLVISPDSDLAMIAPVDCRKDPVSVIDLARGTFVENLPGFGPVAFSPDGETVIAFGRQAELATFGIASETPYSLLFISTRDWSIETLEIGDALPIYSLTPDGQVVLVFSVFESASYDGIFMIDVATKTIRETSGPEVPLSEFVITPDSRLVYLIEGGLFRLDVATGVISYVTIACGGVGEPTRCNPELVNLLPDGDTLVLGWRNEPEYALFDVPSERVTRTFVVGERAGGPPLAQ